MNIDYDRHHFSILAKYNRAANENLFALLGGLPSEEFTVERGSYFGSIRGILNHIIMCDINWLRRFREIFSSMRALSHVRLQPAGHAWTTYEFDTLEELSRERTLVDGIFSDFVEMADTSRFGDILSYTDSHGAAKRYIFRDAVDHVFNHQTHHRGQISQILDELGVSHDFSNIISVLEKV